MCNISYIGVNFKMMQPLSFVYLKKNKTFIHFHRSLKFLDSIILIVH